MNIHIEFYLSMLTK